MRVPRVACARKCVCDHFQTWWMNTSTLSCGFMVVDVGVSPRAPALGVCRGGQIGPGFPGGSLRGPGLCRERSRVVAGVVGELATAPGVGRARVASQFLSALGWQVGLTLESSVTMSSLHRVKYRRYGPSSVQRQTMEGLFLTLGAKEFRRMARREVARWKAGGSVDPCVSLKMEIPAERWDAPFGNVCVHELAGDVSLGVHLGKRDVGEFVYISFDGERGRTSGYSDPDAAPMCMYGHGHVSGAYLPSRGVASITDLAGPSIAVSLHSEHVAIKDRVLFGFVGKGAMGFAVRIGPDNYRLVVVHYTRSCLYIGSAYVHRRPVCVCNIRDSKWLVALDGNPNVFMELRMDTSGLVLKSVPLPLGSDVSYGVYGGEWRVLDMLRVDRFAKGMENSVNILFEQLYGARSLLCELSAGYGRLGADGVKYTLLRDEMTDLRPVGFHANLKLGKYSNDWRGAYVLYEGGYARLDTPTEIEMIHPYMTRGMVYPGPWTENFDQRQYCFVKGTEGRGGAVLSCVRRWRPADYSDDEDGDGDEEEEKEEGEEEEKKEPVMSLSGRIFGRVDGLKTVTRTDGYPTRARGACGSYTELVDFGDKRMFVHMGWA